MKGTPFSKRRSRKSLTTGKKSPKRWGNLCNLLGTLPEINSSHLKTLGLEDEFPFHRFLSVNGRVEDPPAKATRKGWVY